MLDVNLVGFSDLTISGGVVQSKEETQSLHDSKASTVQYVWEPVLQERFSSILLVKSSVTLNSAQSVYPPWFL